jgi:RNA polymerase sigma-70 factor (ECF subfamily)
VATGETFGLLEEALSGSETARAALLERLRPRIVLWAATRLSPALRAHLDPEDVAQEILLAVHRDLGAFRGGDARAFYGWLFTVGENRIRDLADRYGAQKRRTPDPVPRSDTSPSGRASRTEACERVKRALLTLSEDHQRVVQLVRLEERPYDEAALVLGRSVNAVRILYCRALKALRGALGDES